MALRVSRSGYYRWLGREQSAGAERNRELLKEIRRVYDEHKGRYGSPRITQQLRKEGMACGENRVARLMRENGLVSCSSEEGFSATDDYAGSRSGAQPDQADQGEWSRSSLDQ